MPICAICYLSFQDIKNLLIHFKLIHNLKPDDRYNCGENACTRHFPSLNSYRKHLKVHVDSLNNTSNDCSNVSNTFEISEASFLSNETHTSLESSNDTNDCDIKDNKAKLQNLLNIMNRKMLVFFSSLYANNTLNRANVQIIMEHIKDLFLTPLNQLKKHVIDIVQDHDIPVQHYIDESFDVLTNVLETFNSEHLRLKLLKESGCYIPPEEIVIGEHIEQTSSNCEPHHKTVTAAFIPLRHVLKSFFQLPNVFQFTNNFIKNIPHPSQCNNLVFSSYWKEIVTNIEIKTNHVILPLTIFFDEYEVGNPLGSHAGIHKLGAIYAVLPCLPPMYQGSLSNIFLTLLFHSADLKEFGDKCVFSKLLEELKFLEHKGIIINSENQQYTLFFRITLITGDNLGVHAILGFVESFSATFNCRFCKSPRNETQYMFVQNNDTLRNIENYKFDIRLNNCSITGLKKSCIWNELSIFHVTKNFFVDVMHDIYEGVAVFDVVLILHRFIIIDKMFTLEEINSKIKYFKYGSQHTNVPPLFSEDNLKKKNLKMSASEMKTFILYFGVIIGEYIDERNPYWNLFISLRKMLTIILSNTISNEACDELKLIVEEHNKLYTELFHEPLKPKHHHLIHYPMILKNIGPIKPLSSFRCESKHRISKLAANTVASRKNISKTLAIKHQLQLCNRFAQKDGFNLNISCTKSTLFNIYDIFPEINNMPLESQSILKNFCKSSVLAETVQVHKTVYKNGQVLYISGPRSPKFGIISHILVDSNYKEVCFIYKEVKVIMFYEHFYSYEVVLNETYSFVFQSKLYYHKQVTLNTVNNGKNYISVLF